MKKKYVRLLATLLVTTSIIEAKAEQLTINSDGNLPGLSTGTDFSNNASSGIIIDGDNNGEAWNINIDNDITINNNTTYGIDASSGAVKFTSDNKTINISENGNRNIFVGSNGETIFNNTNINATHNLLNSQLDKVGIAVEGLAVFNSQSGNNSLTLSENRYGLATYTNGETYINDYNIETNRGDIGIISENGGYINIQGNGTNTLRSNDNIRSGITAWGTDNSSIFIEGYNIETKGNASGIEANGTGKIHITGAIDGSNTLAANNNTKKGLNSDGSDSEINIEDMDVEANGNIIGVEALNGGKIKITGIENGNNILTANSNKAADESNGRGIQATGQDSSIYIRDMDVVANNNAIFGIVSHLGSDVTIIGSNEKKNKVSANNNKNSVAKNSEGIHANAGNINILNIDVEANENSKSGIASYYGSIINIIGNINGKNKVTTNQNETYAGMHSIDQNSKINIVNADIEANGNLHGIVAENEGNINIIGEPDGKNKLSANQNRDTTGTDGVGILVSDINSVINIEGMNIKATDNTTGLKAKDGGILNITGNGSNSLQANNNINDAGTNGLGIHTSGANSEINIKNMNIETKGNGHGISSNSGGKIDIVGTADGQNALISSNSTIGGGIISIDNASVTSIKNMDIIASDNLGSNISVENGGYINIAGISSGANNLILNNSQNNGAVINNSNSKADILNMNIQSNKNQGDGLKSMDGGGLNITGITDGINWLQANNNKNTAGTDGAGIHSSGTNSEINIENINIETNDNVYGIEASHGGKINITSASGISNSLQANNNKNTAGNSGVGLLARDSDSEMNIKDINITLINNASSGIYVFGGGKINISGDGNNYIYLLDNLDSGIYTSSGEINIENMNILADNSGRALYVSNTGKMTIKGNGNNTISAINGGSGISAIGTTSSMHISDANLNLSNNNYGMAVHTKLDIIGSLTGDKNTLIANNNSQDGIHANFGLGNGTAINIENMDIQTNNNSANGINANNAGIINITGRNDGSNILQANNNKDATNANGIGIYSKDVNSEINIKNTNIEVSDNTQGITANDGGAINIVGTPNGENNLIVKNNYTAVGEGRAITASGLDSTINITNMNMNISENKGRGLYASNKGLINIHGNGENVLIVNGFNKQGNGTAILSTLEGSLIDIKDMNIISNGNGYSSIGATSGAKVNIEGKADRNSMIIKDGTHAIHVRHKGSSGLSSEANILNMNILSNKTLANVGEAGTLNIKNSTISMDKGSNAFNTNDDATINLTDTDIYGSSILLDTKKSATDPSNVVNLKALNSTNKTLEGSISTITDINTNVEFDKVNWNMKSSSNISDFKITDSNIDLRQNGGFNTLTLGSFDALGTNNFYLNTKFDASGTNTDKVIIDGGAANGSGTLYVTSAGDDGSQTDVMVVDLTNSTTNTMNFDLFGNVVDSGAYEYELHKLADNNWYLQSNGRATGTAKMASSMPAIHYSIIKTGMNELRKRLGELRDNDHSVENGLWVRSYAKHMHVDDFVNNKLSLVGFEAGYDREIYSWCDNKVYAGIMAGYLYSDDIKASQKTTAGNSGASAHANTPSVGIYATWINHLGWFADATIREFFSDMKTSSTTAQGNSISYRSKRNFTTASLELGKQIEYRMHTNFKYILEPKIEAQYFTSKSDSLRTNSGHTLKYGQTQSFSTRAALMAGYNAKILNSMTIEPFIELGVSREWDGKTDINYSGSKFRSDLEGTTYDFVLGINSQLNRDFSVYSDVTYENGSVAEAISANVGLRYTW